MLERSFCSGQSVAGRSEDKGSTALDDHVERARGKLSATGTITSAVPVGESLTRRWP
jgi:hypothetical protein